MFKDYEEEEFYKTPQEGWQTVECTEAEKSLTQKKAEKLTLSIKCTNGAKVNYAYQVIFGHSLSNAQMTILLRAFGVSTKAKDEKAFIGKTAEVYLHKEPAYNDPSKSYWKIRNFKYFSATENCIIESPILDGKKENKDDKPPMSAFENLYGNDNKNTSAADGDGGDDKIPF
ncbi:MAG: hypothetical protein LBU09_03425 [Endomicrobium sp.]|jgi:hypothetical protein|nr:hypothetical protein [Endomicrobium sp.]